MGMLPKENDQYAHRLEKMEEQTILEKEVSNIGLGVGKVSPFRICFHERPKIAPNCEERSSKFMAREHISFYKTSGTTRPALAGGWKTSGRLLPLWSPGHWKRPRRSSRAWEEGANPIYGFLDQPFKMLDNRQQNTNNTVKYVSTYLKSRT